jgi:WD40 repeat protein
MIDKIFKHYLGSATALIAIVAGVTLSSCLSRSKSDEPAFKPIIEQSFKGKGTSAVAISDDTEVIAYSLPDTFEILWTNRVSGARQVLKSPKEDIVFSLILSGDGEELISQTAGGEVSRWRSQVPPAPEMFRTVPFGAQVTYGASLARWAYVVEGRRVAIHRGDDPAVFLDTRVVQPDRLIFDERSERLIICETTEGRRSELWDTSERKLLGYLPGCNDASFVDGDSALLVVNDYVEGSYVLLSNLRKLDKAEVILKYKNETIQSLVKAWNREEFLLKTCSKKSFDDCIYRYVSKAEDNILPLDRLGFSRESVSQNGRYLIVTSNDGKLRVWDVEKFRAK